MLCLCCCSRSKLRQGPKQNDATVVKEGSGSEGASLARRVLAARLRSKGQNAITARFCTGQRNSRTTILSFPKLQIPISWKKLDFRPLCLFLGQTKKQRERGKKISLERIFCIHTIFNVTATMKFEVKKLSCLQQTLLRKV